MKPGLFVLILILSVTALVLAVLKFNSIQLLHPSTSSTLTPTPVSEKNIFGNEIAFTARDKSAISATLYSPLDISPPFKSLILVHEFDSDRSDWSSIIPILLENGYRVFAYDLRGMGKSVSQTPKDSPEKYFNTLVTDLSDAVEYLRNLPDTDREHIGIIGSSIGANIVYIHSGLDQNTTSASVAISPVNTTSFLSGKNLTKFRPSNIFFITDQKDSVASQDFFGKSSNPKSIKIYPNTQSHGVELLKDQQTIDDILNWLSTNI